ncbi:MAG: D-glycerate dehydrogenase [Candidatus Eremiobacteraeota bacterium]|nr:D-glycerate dehydrogenase [Candidatus Eremiobacteraeota bacterium]MBV8365854.1 D-glycerate dehydrogenase [Candidatus Eremiobacteraeota bacterium]
MRHSKPRVFVTRVIPDAGLTLLEKHTDADVWPHDRAPTREELVRGAKNADALVTLLTEKVDADVLAAAPRVRIVANVAVGFDNFDVAAATKAGVVMTNTPGVLDDTTADLAFALLLCTARRLAEGDRLMRTGAWDGWGIMQLLGHDVHHATLGIVGFGRIGRGVARRALGFDMTVLYADEFPASPEVERELHVTRVPLDELLARSDFVTLHTPLLPGTKHLINAQSLEKMKRTACLINTSRGPVIDEAALVQALRSGTIAGAGLDVYEHEPKMAPGLAELDNVVILPHIGSASYATRGKMAQMAASNVIAFFEGKTPPNALNPEALTRPT